VSIIQTREASYKDSNPDEIEIGNSRLKNKNSHISSNSPFHNAYDIELEMWSGCVKEISKIVQNQLKISKDIFSETFEHRKDSQIDHKNHFTTCLIKKILKKKMTTKTVTNKVILF